MKKVNARWEETRSIELWFNCPHCDQGFDEDDIIIQQGGEFKGTVICMQCKKEFEVEVKKA